MTTDALRELTAAACTRMHGKLWPNGIGFDKLGGWEISYSEHAAAWFAGRHLTNNRRRFAYASTPEAALAHARTPGQYTEEADYVLR